MSYFTDHEQKFLGGTLLVLLVGCLINVLAHHVPLFNHPALLQAAHSGRVLKRIPVFNINEATETQLNSLPGIGQALAGRIVAYRRAHGKFLKLDGLLRVKGLTQKTYRHIYFRLTL